MASKHLHGPSSSKMMSLHVVITQLNSPHGLLRQAIVILVIKNVVRWRFVIKCRRIN